MALYIMFKCTYRRVNVYLRTCVNYNRFDVLFSNIVCNSRDFS